ncbi:MAG: phage holin family protein [Nocardioides sp.]|uniref:phage holin family protein n=1 Tax=Nocardioides sp. TaxID=35761 RepID=UPI0039E23BBB
MRFLAWLLTTAVALAVAAQLLGGIAFDGPSTWPDELRHKLLPLLAVAVVMGGVNALVRPVVTFLSLPFVILTLGLFLLVVNALMLKLTAWLAGGLGIGFHVDGFGTAVLGSIIITIVTWIVDGLLSGDRR